MRKAVEIGSASNSFELKPSTTVVYLDPAEQAIAQVLVEDIRSKTGLTLATAQRADCPSDAICLIVQSRTGPPPTGINVDGYLLNIDNGVKIQAPHANGAFNATRTLLQLLQDQNGHFKAPSMQIRDWPTVRERILTLDVARQFYPLEDLKNLIRQMAYYKMNYFHIHFTDAQAFRLNSPRYPGLAPSVESYSRDDIKELEAFARKYHVSIIPEIDLPGHATALGNYYARSYGAQGKTINFTCPSMASYTIGGVIYPRWTIDVTKPEAVAFVKQVVGEFAPWFEGKYFHIGGDEYPNQQLMSQCGQLVNACLDPQGRIRPACQGRPDQPAMVPGGLFVDFMNDMNRFVRGLGKTTRIWTGWDAVSLNAKYSMSPRDPDRDIVIDSWLLNDPQLLVNKGFHVANHAYTMTYLTPGFAQEEWDFPPPENYLLNSWQPNVFSRTDNHKLDPDEEKFLGASFNIWNDGMTDKPTDYVLTLAARPLALIANAAWTGGKTQSMGLDQFVAIMEKTGPAPASITQRPPQVTTWQAPVGFNGYAPLGQSVSDIPVPWSATFCIKRNQGANDATQFLLNSSLTSLNIFRDGERQVFGMTTGTANGSTPDTPVGRFSFPYDVADGWQAVTLIGTPSGTSLWDSHGKIQASNLNVMSLPVAQIGKPTHPLQHGIRYLRWVNRALSPAGIAEASLPCGQ
ncbi:family 20 glycosylhydrolase [Chitinimonas arctica]|nr:family 20 glycosylhydrolase [Chitinimonas arctica]